MRNLILLIKRYLFLLYPSPEFVVIHKDASVLKNVQSLEDFVREVFYDHHFIFIFVITS